MANAKVAPAEALYLYGISPAQQAPAKIGRAGIDGAHPIEAMPCGQFLCWVSRVDQAAFSRELETNMENLDWLAVHGVRHQEAVGEIARTMTVVPARFGTLFSGAKALEQNVRARKAALTKAFEKIVGADEWGVKVFNARQPQATLATPVAASGRDYLQQKAARIKRRAESGTEDLKELADALARVASDSAPSGKVSGGQADLVWQATFLVPRKKHAEWNRVLQEFVQRWSSTRRIEVSGPWPPYSFVADAG
ncbi:MAG TPA: GvpL/GvpF family gas vesicle protein [Candidatus Limnocylindrales bacterium]|nr:GvpL/GvpF family gas vesicle protein [Candidatus Limnocylindrales bacterium]